MSKSEHRILLQSRPIFGVSDRSKEGIRIIWVVIFSFDALGIVCRRNGWVFVPYWSERFPNWVGRLGLQLDESVFKVPECVWVEPVLFQDSLFHSNWCLCLLIVRCCVLWLVVLDLNNSDHRTGQRVPLTYGRLWPLIWYIVARISSTLITVVFAPIVLVLVGFIPTAASMCSLVILTSGILLPA